MYNKKYIIKSLAPWMLDELLAFSQLTKFDIIFLRIQDDFYNQGIEQLRKRGVGVYERPRSWKNLFKKLFIAFKFLIRNIYSFRFNYNLVIGFKSILWFLSLDLSLFSENSKIHAQFATQPALVSLLIKEYFNKQPEYSFTFHAYDIYFKNRWFKTLINNCKKAFSISEYNIKYINKNYGASNKLSLCRLGVFRSEIDKIDLKEKDYFVIGLMSWFIEKKGIIYLLKTLKVFKDKGIENIKLKLAGDGPLRSELLEFIKENQLGNMIDFLGKLNSEEKKGFYNSLDVFVLPAIQLKNDQDGIPVVLMEAIAYSIPIISTNISGIPEICIDNYNGRLIKEKNVDELYHAIFEIYDDFDKRKAYAHNSYVLSSEYDMVSNSKVKLKQLGWI